MALSSEQFRPVVVDDRGAEQPPEGHYEQPKGHQEVLPGMEMTPQEHVRALGRSLGLRGSLVDSEGWHRIDLHHPEADPEHDEPVAHLEWAKHDSQEGAPGEVNMVDVFPDLRRRGIASRMLSTAETISREHPGVSAPRGSTARSEAGKAWSRAKMAERGAEVW